MSLPSSAKVWDGPAVKASSLSASTTLTAATRAVYCAVGGNPVLTLMNDSSSVTFTGMVAGTIYPIRVIATGSLGGATLIGLY